MFLSRIHLSWVALVLVLTCVEVMGQIVDGSSRTASSTAFYTAFEDKSWAINEQDVSNDLGRQRDLYKEFLDDCGKLIGPAYCQDQEYYRMQMNMYQPRSMVNYTKTGFHKSRLPDRLFRRIRTFWETNRNEQVEEFPDRVSTFHNSFLVPTHMVNVENETLTGGGSAFAARLSDSIRTMVEDWIGMRVAFTSTYGIRVYHNQSILAPHVDRLPLVTSVIVNVDQDVAEPWPLEVYDHDGIAHNVTLEPGDMLFYESHSVIHGRPFPLNGSYFANIFFHYEPVASPEQSSSGVRIAQYFPPYILPDSSWEVEWRENNPQGWPLFREPWKLVERGDLQTLHIVADVDPSRLDRPDERGWYPLFHACVRGHLDLVAFLVEHGVDVNAINDNPHVPSALAVSDAKWGEDSAISQYLRGHGAVLDPRLLAMEYNGTARTEL